MARLTDKQRREVIGFLEAGQEIPDDFKHVLFPAERREHELVYAGKEREEDIIANTWGVPLQAVKTFNLPPTGSPRVWSNRLIFGNNLQVMKRLLDDPQVKGRVRLVYIDPPFATRQEFRGSQDQKAYQDKIAGAEFIEFLRKRLVLIRELLADDGTVYIHLDQRKSHYIKVVADEVFADGAFRNEIIWRNTNAHNKLDTFGKIHQTLLMYTRSGRLYFNKEYRPLFRKYVEKHYRHGESRDTRWSDPTGDGTRSGESGREWLGYDPTRAGRHWAIPNFVYDMIDEDISEMTVLQKLDYLLKAGLIERPKEHGGQPQFRRPVSQSRGNALQDIWAYQPYTEGIYYRGKEALDQDVSWAYGDNEGLDYPTQKPEGLLARIIRSSSGKDDLVLDAFAGSGTTLAVAEKLGRRWIGIDSSKFAIYTMQRRLLRLRRGIGNTGPELKAEPFTLCNAGLYDIARMSELPWNDYRLFALQLFQIRDRRHTLAGLALDGYRGDADVLVFDFKQDGDVVVDEEYVKELHRHVGSKARREFYIVAPAARVTFLEDYIDMADTRYYILRIPYSIIDELHDRPFEQIRQPVGASEINSTVDAVGFDFIVPPEVEAEYCRGKRGAELFEDAVVHIRKFASVSMTRKPRKYKNFETLAMVMVDYDYRGNGDGAFDLDEVFFREQIERQGWQLRLDLARFGKRIMIIYLDIFGNELREVKSPSDFGLRSSSTAKAGGR
jgi:site-specific DNA-methyltransferase (adenine-specific)/adenine-specific DNA-methyltransferase